MSLAREVGAELRKVARFGHSKIINMKGNDENSTFPPYPSMNPSAEKKWNALLRQIKNRVIGYPGLRDELREEHMISLQEWIDKYDKEELWKSIFIGFAASGYGHLDVRQVSIHSNWHLSNN